MQIQHTEQCGMGTVRTLNSFVNSNLKLIVLTVFNLPLCLCSYQYSIETGNEDKVFAISKTDGTITIIRSIAMETRSQYNLTVYAEDGTQTYTGRTFVVIKVIDINSYSPMFDAPNSVEVLETHLLSTPVLRFFVHDPDYGRGGQVSVFIKRTQGRGTFRLNNDGNDAYNLYSSVAFNASEQDHYSVLLVAQDRGSPSRLTELRLTIRVQDVNEPPLFSLPCARSGHCSASFPEDSPEHHIVEVITAYDTDTGMLSDITYTFTTTTTLFSIDDNGTVTLTRTIDYDTAPVTEFRLEVVVRDGGGMSSTTTLSLFVIDVNDNVPQFSPSSFNITVKESTSRNANLRSLVARDGDEGEKGQVVYSLKDTSTFAINPSTGDLTLIGALDYESRVIYNFVVVATDRGKMLIPGHQLCT